MLYLNARDIEEVLSLQEMVDAVERALVLASKNQYFMPERFHISQASNTLLLMPCFTEKYFGTKLVSVFPYNAEKNKPVINGNMILNKGDTGEVLAILDGAKLTAMRTGAVGGLAVRYLAKEEARHLAVIGAGVQGAHQAVFALSQRDITNVYVCDLSDKNIAGFKRQIDRWHSNVFVQKVDSASEAVKKADIVITATNSLKPVIPDDKALLKNKTFIGIGSFKPNMQEFPKSLYDLCENVFVDTMVAKKESGDIATPLAENWIKEENIIEISDIVSGNVAFDIDAKQTSLFKSVGMGLFDLIVAETLYEKADKLEIGQKLIT